MARTVAASLVVKGVTWEDQGVAVLAVPGSFDADDAACEAVPDIGDEGKHPAGGAPQLVMLLLEQPKERRPEEAVFVRWQFHTDDSCCSVGEESHVDVAEKVAVGFDVLPDVDEFVRKLARMDDVRGDRGIHFHPLVE